MNQIISADTIRKERNKGHQIFQRIAAWPGRIFSTELNPLYHLGGITILMFIIACISGIYIFIFYNINPRHAWDSVEAISNNYFNGWMRSIHRYSSDLLVVFILLQPVVNNLTQVVIFKIIHKHGKAFFNMLFNYMLNNKPAFTGAGAANNQQATKRVDDIYPAFSNPVF